MILISHRGNIDGPNPEMENTLPYIRQAVLEGYDCEIDVWGINHKLYLGHDRPQCLVKQYDLEVLSDFLWIHAKNINAANYLRGSSFNVFSHDRDNFVVTSKGYPWCYPHEEVLDDAINLMPELHGIIKEELEGRALGVCSDYIGRYK